MAVSDNFAPKAFCREIPSGKMERRIIHSYASTHAEGKRQRSERQQREQQQQARRARDPIPSVGNAWIGSPRKSGLQARLDRDQANLAAQEAAATPCEPRPLIAGWAAPSCVGRGASSTRRMQHPQLSATPASSLSGSACASPCCCCYDGAAAASGGSHSSSLKPSPANSPLHSPVMQRPPPP